MVFGALASGPTAARPSMRPPLSQKDPTVVQRGARKVASKVALPMGRTRVTVRVAVRVRPFSAAEMVAVSVTFWASVVTVNVPLVAPWASASVAGTVAAAVLLELSVTTEPPAGTGPLSVMVAVDGVPPGTVFG